MKIQIENHTIMRLIERIKASNCVIDKKLFWEESTKGERKFVLSIVGKHSPHKILL
jgi:hypothetical protein